MQTFEIPLTAQPQNFNITLVGIQYEFTLVWRDTTNGGWFLDIADASGNALLSGIPLVTGVNLLAQYAYMAFGFELWVQTDAADAPPTFTNLGTESHLYCVIPL
ncbi:phage baseplate plug family protein [Ralstonia pseudosolanacearum]|uniref:phage baseplate plug family protein n=1 Tax=Ralstonia pseudosolanacearum TaxID=1310165 RepID=UPI003EE35297